MANQTNSPEGITQTYSEYNPDFRKASTKQKWDNKEELQTARYVLDRFGQMDEGVRTSCPFVWPSDGDADIDEDALGGGMIGGQGSWFDYLDRCDKQWSMIRLVRDDEVELRSATTFSPVEAAMADFQKGDIVVLMEPDEYEEDIAKVKLINRAHDHLYYKPSTRIKQTDKETYHDCLKYGFSWRFDGWFNRTQEVTILQNSDELLKGADDKKKKEIKEQLKKGPITKTETVTTYDDIGHVRVSPWEIYPDPDARYVRHHVYDMKDIIWRQTPTVDAAIAEFQNSNDPYILTHNLEKIVTAAKAYASYDASNKPFFKPPEDIDENSQVVLLRYWNKLTDKYIVLINDVVIRDGPLSYNHKELPFVLHKLIDWEGQLRGVGLAAMVEGLQSEDEELRSLFMEQLKITIAPPLFYNKMIGEDLDAWEKYQAGQLIGVSGPVDGGMMQWMPTNGGNLNWFNARGDLSQLRTEVTGIDPMASSAPRPDEAVRTHMLSMEATQKIMGKYLQNWGDARVEAVWMDIRLMQQFYPTSYVESIDGQGNKQTKYKVVKTRGEKITIKQTSTKISLESEKAEYGFFKMKNEYLELMGDVDIRINFDQIQRPSKTQMMANSRDLLNTLTPIYSNEQVREAPGMTGLIHWVTELHNAPPTVTEEIRDASSQNDVELARMQNEVMANGEIVPGTPGQSFKHVGEHVELLDMLFAEKQKHEKDKQKFINPKEQTAEAFRTASLELERIDIIIGKLDELITTLSAHIEDDRKPRSSMAQTAIERAQPAPQMDPAAMMMGGVADPSMNPMAGSMGAMGGDMMGMGAPMPPQMDPAAMMGAAAGMPPGIM